MGVKMLFYPHKPAGLHQRMFRYAQAIGLDWTNDINDKGITHAHHYTGMNIREYPTEMLKCVPDGSDIINYNLLNIKKDHIDNVFKEVFGYSICVDPTQHYGSMVRKGTQNAVHGGKIVTGPIPPHLVDNRTYYSSVGTAHSRMYQKLIDTRIMNDMLRDFRFVIMGGELVLLYEKHLGIKSTFHAYAENYFHAYAHYSYEKFFRQEEIGKIEEFVRLANIDFAEIDVLRDNSTDLIYIIDINDVPGGGIWDHMDNSESVIDYLANTYKQKYLS